MTSPSQEEPKTSFAKVQGKPLFIVSGQDELTLYDGTKVKIDPAPVPNEPSDNIEVIERYEHGVPSEYSLDGGKTWKTKYEPSAIGDEQDNPLKQQLDRLIIENQSEDGSIDISDQRAMRDEILSLIEEQTKQAILKDLKKFEKYRIPGLTERIAEIEASIKERSEG